LIEADYSGRPPLPKGNPFSSWLDLAGTLNIQNNAPVAILLGRHLIPMGVKPGVGMGELLNKAYEAQLDNQFSDLEGAVAFVQSLLSIS
jgi:tRNA nucleotidyltransferase (CCA-adding enzyme)